ncbi:DUF1450 domain-containing protein [Listeria sp. PSOL-1]|uniref:DUF1450 domain-containing protein n=1 Tax=Listeria sp. PSOL-1 TaxID=1844999 RepID=UPI0013D89A44|nr:DUF1450 domain-containing protein [Listeria sp. PSOL-1]
MKPLVEFCVNNLASGAFEVYDTLLKDENVDVIQYDCLAHCELCGRSLFALVEGVVVSGRSKEELLKKIYQQL